ncbi:MAG: hypothetical protein H6739_05010 [Alphaproteobacteria bacterium]|nr:hypothetical protein [Alphaproteobacteria bacterium]
MLITLLLSCVSETVISYSTEPCQNWDLDSEDPPLVEAVEWGEGLEVTRNGIYRGCDASFSPDIEPDGKVFRVYEAWEDDSEDCDACWMAQIQVAPLRRGTYEIQWFTEDSDTVPSDDVTVDVP